MQKNFYLIEVMCQPLEQFEVFAIFFFFNNFIITNMFIYLSLVTFFIYVYIKLTSLQMKVLSKNSQNLFEQLYNFVFTLVKQQLNVKGYAYFPLILCLFLFILSANLIGMCLYSFTVTS